MLNFVKILAAENCGVPIGSSILPQAVDQAAPRPVYGNKSNGKKGNLKNGNLGNRIGPIRFLRLPFLSNRQWVTLAL